MSHNRNTNDSNSKRCSPVRCCVMLLPCGPRLPVDAAAATTPLLLPMLPPQAPAATVPPMLSAAAVHPPLSSPQPLLLPAAAKAAVPDDQSQSADLPGDHVLAAAAAAAAAESCVRSKDSSVNAPAASPTNTRVPS